MPGPRWGSRNTSHNYAGDRWLPQISARHTGGWPPPTACSSPGPQWQLSGWSQLIRGSRKQQERDVRVLLPIWIYNPWRMASSSRWALPLASGDVQGGNRLPCPLASGASPFHVWPSYPALASDHGPCVDISSTESSDNDVCCLPGLWLIQASCKFLTSVFFNFTSSCFRDN